jgi:rRNA maturation protein Nop10
MYSGDKNSLTMTTTLRESCPLCPEEIYLDVPPE